MSTKRRSGKTPIKVGRGEKLGAAIERAQHPEPELTERALAALLEDTAAADTLVHREREKRRTFLEGRQQGVGASDLWPILTGGALEKYNEKTRPVTDDDVLRGENAIDLLRGVLLEPIAWAWYVRVTGRAGKRERGQFFHPDYPGAMCSPDATIFADPERPPELADTGTGEVKAPRSYIYGDLALYGTRESIVVQVQGSIAVRRKRWGSLGYFNLEHNAGPLIPVDLPADVVLGEFLLELSAKFWTEHVVERVPPNPEKWAAMLDKAPAITMPKSDGLLRVIGERESERKAVELYRALVDAQRAKKDAETLVEQVKGELDAWLLKEFGAAATKFQIPHLGKLTRIASKGQTYFDRAALEAHKPIDRDAFVRFLRDGNWGYMADEVDRLADSLSLDLDIFKRPGEPYAYLRAYPAKEE